MRTTNWMKLRFFVILFSISTMHCQGRIEPDGPDRSFSDQIQHFSESGGYFDTDNLISNESSYLHVMDQLRDLNIQGGAYIGVGPDQNFSYIAQIKPEIAFVIDIRRDNLLQHLMFKALFHYSPNRMSFLCNLLGKMEPDGILDWDSRSISDIIAYIERSDTRVQPDTKRLIDYLEGKKIPLTDQEKDTIRRFHRNFINAGLNLKFTSHNRGPLSEYPSYRDLILEKDRSGQQVNYLVSESSYDYVRDLQERDRIIPVVGNLAGDQAIKSISTFLNAENIEVSAFYTSNVEFYLAGQNNISGFIDNLKSLPIKDNGVIIRSYFSRWSNHPLSVQGYASTQMIQRMFRLIEGHEEGNLIRYNQMVEDFEPLK